MNRFLSLIKDYWLIVFALYCTGSIYFVSFNYSTAIPLLFIASLFAFIIAKEKNAVLTGEQIFSFVCLLLFMAFVWIFNGVTQYTPYFAIIFQLAASILITMVIPLKEFIRRYTNAICFFAAASLVFFAVYLVYPQFALLFDRTVGDASVYYYNAYIHVFESMKGYSSFVPFYRNSGIFWEPGAYQAFLNIALLFILSDSDQAKSKYTAVKIGILMLTVITTYSTTGYILMVIILLANFRNFKKHMAIKGLFSIMLIVALILFFGFVNSRGLGVAFMSDKLTTEFGEEGTFLGRLFLDDLTIIFEKAIYFFGISYEEYAARELGSGNSIVQTMVTLGVPFTLILLGMYLRFSAKLKRTFLLFLVFLIVFSTESLLWRPIFLCYAWYGLGANVKHDNVPQYAYN